MHKSKGTIKMTFYSCKSNIVENLTPLDLKMTFVNIFLTISLTYSKTIYFCDPYHISSNLYP